MVAVNTLADKVQKLINSGADPDELQAFVDTLRANDAALSDAIKARTAAVSEPAPVPVEPQVQPRAAFRFSLDALPAFGLLERI